MRAASMDSDRMTVGAHEVAGDAIFFAIEPTQDYVLIARATLLSQQRRRVPRPRRIRESRATPLP